MLIWVQSADERALGLSADPVSRTYWVYTDRSILEVLVKNEDRDVWRAKLEKGEYASALDFIKVSLDLEVDDRIITSQSAPQRDIVLSKQGDALFEQGRFIQAAQCYAKSSRSFEYVCLRFVDVDERDALRIYLSDRLDLLDKHVSPMSLAETKEPLMGVGPNTADDACYMAYRDLPEQMQHPRRYPRC